MQPAAAQRTVGSLFFRSLSLCIQENVDLLVSEENLDWNPGRDLSGVTYMPCALSPHFPDETVTTSFKGHAEDGWEGSSAPILALGSQSI